MNIVHLHPGADTGGQSMAGKAVLEAAGHNVRVFVHGMHSFGYKAAEKWEDDLVRNAYREADVVIIHNDARLFARVDDGTRKNLIVHHHGTRFRTRPSMVSAEAEAIGARQVASTVDLLVSAPDPSRVSWFPQVVDVDRMRMIRDLHRPSSGKFRVTHAPTNRQVKGTRHVIGAMRRLKDEAEFDIISRQPWTMCLARKAASDLFIDQFLLGYGNNAIEAWAMDLPVIAAAHEPILAMMRRVFGGYLPFYSTTPNLLVADIRSFMASPEVTQAWADIGRKHVERYHAPEAWLANAERIFAA